MATMTVTLQDIQQRLPELLPLISRGNTIIIEKDKKPLAQLVGIKGATKKRIAGLNRGKIRAGDDFDSPLPDKFWLQGR
jgi:antitoxin (DNA-binding transcriptional repressor) of toxin-antitoxin stability system